MKFYSEIVKHMWNGSKFALFRLEAKNFYKRNGLTLVAILPGYGWEMTVYGAVFAAHLWDSGDMSQSSQAMGEIWSCMVLYLLPTF